MARTKFNAPNIGNCSLIYYSDLGGSVSVSGPIYFPWSFEPTLYGLVDFDLNGTYSFDCSGCTYVVKTNEYTPTPTPTNTSTPTNSVTPTNTPTNTETPTNTPTITYTPTPTPTP